MRELKKLYNAFLDSGDLKALYPEMTGDWEKDKKEFEKQMKPAAQKFVSDVDVDSLEEDLDDEDI